MTGTARRHGPHLSRLRRLLRRLLMCPLQQCGGTIEHDQHGTYWQCATCAKKVYA